jgi:hypothetical protein
MWLSGAAASGTRTFPVRVLDRKSAEEVNQAEGGVRETVRDGINGLRGGDDPRAIARAVSKLDSPRR